MWRTSVCSCAVMVALACPAVDGQQDKPTPADTSAVTNNDTDTPGGVEILSDTLGVNVKPYVKQILKLIYKNWVPLIPAEAKAPELRPGATLIRFTIGPDGHLVAMHLDGSTHDDAINRSCWGAITSTDQFPPLPPGLESKPLELRIHFYVNSKPH